MKKELSVVVPAYNEEKAIEETLRETADYLSKKGYAFEILVVNDGSTDRTPQIVRDLAKPHPQIRLIEQPKNMGKGDAVKEGIRHARYPVTLFMDADNATSIREWDKFEAQFQNGAKVVIASRHLRGSNIVHPQPWIRRFLGGGYRTICRMLFGLTASDFNCGFKAYETPIAKTVYSEVQMRDWAFDTEVFCLLKRQGVDAAEVPVRWEHKEKVSNLKPVGTAFKTLKSLFALKQRY